jgi:hypothetical protein
MSEPRDDRELEEYLRGDSMLSRRYRQVSGEEPAPAVDEAILAASRRAAQSRPALLPRSWFKPVSLAAIVVLSVTIVITLQRGPDMDQVSTPEPATEVDTKVPGTRMEKRERAPDAPAAMSVRPREAPADVLMSPSQEVLRMPARELEQAPPPATEPPVAQPEAPEPLPAPALKVIPREMEAAEEVARPRRGLNILRPGAESASPAPAEKRPPVRMREAPLAAWAPSAALTPEEDLAGIAKLWNADRKEAALNRLRRVLAEHPYYPDRDLLRTLPQELYWEAQRIKGW